MRLARGLAGAVLWILAALLGLVAVVLCVTVVLLPLGIPLLWLARRLFTRAVRLMLPASVAHPVRGVEKSAGRRRDRAAAGVTGAVDQLAKRGRRSRRRLRRAAPAMADLVPGRRPPRWQLWKRGAR